MTRDEKSAAIADLKDRFENSSFFYFTDSSELTVEQVNKLRGLCFKNDIELRVIKNTLAKKALESAAEEKNFGELLDVLAGPTSVMFAEKANTPAKVIEEFRKENDKPVLKAAYIDSSVYLGDESLKELATMKSKEDLIGDIVFLLQSPAKNVVSALKSGGSTLAGLIKALEERGE
jgi:large subunit ribosomal protein L10